jgi:putative transposase
MTTDLALQALLAAVWRRKPKTRVMIHSDQGSQGGFNRSLQHADFGGVDDNRKTEVGALDATQIILARSTASLAA